MRILLTLTIITCFFAGCSQENASDYVEKDGFDYADWVTSNGIDYSEWNNYSNDIEGYSLKYPKDWKTDTRENIVIFTSPKLEGDSFQENVNIMVQDLSQQPMDLDAYTALSEGQIKDLLKTEIQAEHTGLINNNKAVSVKYEMEYGTINLALKQYWFVKGDKAFLITYTATATTFSEFLVNVYGMVGHFSLNK